MGGAATWEKHYNVRKGSTSATLIFSSDELKVTAAAAAVATDAATPPTAAELAPPVEAPKHSYRSLAPVNADRFAYLRRISEGNWSGQASAASGAASRYGDGGLVTQRTRCVVSCPISSVFIKHVLRSSKRQLQSEYYLRLGFT